MKRHLIEEMKGRRKQSEAEANRAVEEVFDGLAAVLGRGDKVTIPGFGTFHSSFRDTRQSRNPRTGESITVQGRNVIKFKEPRKRTR